MLDIIITTLHNAEDNNTETIITVTRDIWEPEENQYEQDVTEYVNTSLVAVLNEYGMTLADCNHKYIIH